MTVAETTVASIDEDSRSPQGPGQPSDPPADPFATVETATAALRSGSAVIVCDDMSADHEGALVFAAGSATTALVAFVVRYSSGFIEVALPPSRATALRLPRQARANIDHDHKPQLISVDAIGVGTGISAADRAATIRALADPASASSDFSRPGHVPTYLVDEDGVVGKIAAEEAAYDLVRLSGAGEVAAYAGLVSDRDPTRMARPAELFDFAAEHELPIVCASAVVADRFHTSDVFGHGAVRSSCELELYSRTFRVTAWEHGHNRTFTLSLGNPSDTVAHVHQECLRSLFDPEGCACRRGLADAVRAIATAGHGLLIYRAITESAVNDCGLFAGDDLPGVHRQHAVHQADRPPSPFGP